MKFADLRLAPALLSAVGKKGFSEPTPIQEMVIPLLLQGTDVIGQAKTGTGKTAAFGLPILQLLSTHLAHKRGVSALILTPTRELAVQVAEEINELAVNTHERALAIYGGQDINAQLRELQKHPRILVGTPGRVLDHLERRTIDLSGVEMFVIDEADRMLDMGFIDDVKRILHAAPPKKQVALFSATMPPEIRHLAEEFLVSPEFVKASGDEVNVAAIAQYYVSVDGRDKLSALGNLLRKIAPKKAIIFCRTKYGADRLAGFLYRMGFESASLHGNLKQNSRDRAMDRFEAGHDQILVATNLASRGLDVEGVDLVFNYDLPEDEKVYLHRIGRTGRAGATGLAYSFVTNLEEIRSIKSFAQRIHASIVEMPADRRKMPFVRDASHHAGSEMTRGASRFGRDRGPRRNSPRGRPMGGGRGRRSPHGGSGRPMRRPMHSGGGRPMHHDRGSSHESHGSHTNYAEKDLF